MLPLGSNALVFSFAIEIRKDKQNMQCMYNVLYRIIVYEGWNFNSVNYLFTTDTK